MNDGNEFKTTYKILNNVLTGDTLQLQYVSCEFEVFNVVHNKENAALNVNVKNGDAYWLSTSGGTIDGNVIINGDLKVTGDVHYTKSSAQISSLIGFNSTLTSSETYYTLVNSDLSGETLHNFVYSGSTGEIIFTGTQPERILFAGSADIEIDSVAATLTFVLFINGNIIERGKTPSDFTSLDRLKNISINRILELEYGDKVTVQVKSSVAGVDLTVSTINLSLWG